MLRREEHPSIEKESLYMREIIELLFYRIQLS